MTILNPAWLSDVPMERIIVHWTAGGYGISDNDLSHYHFLIDQFGGGWRGLNPVSGNARTNKSGDVTSHTKDCNTGSIGISVAAMGNAIEEPFDAGPWPITTLQWDALIKAVVELSIFYKIPVDRETVLMHGEVQANLGIKQDGKWDIGRLPFAEDLFHNSAEVGDYLRTLVNAEIDNPSGREEVGIVSTATVEFTFTHGVVTSVKLV